jgi:hypothetical protein
MLDSANMQLAASKFGGSRILAPLGTLALLLRR